MNNIIKLFLKETTKLDLVIYLLISFVSGISGFWFVKYLNDILSSILNNKELINSKVVITFFIIISVFIVSNRIFSEQITKISVRMFWNIRKQFIQQILKPNFKILTRVKREVHAVLLTDIAILAETAPSLTSFLSSTIISIACFIYLFFLSWKLTFITLLVVIIGISIYQYGVKKSTVKFKIVRELENEFIKHLNAILSGYKQFFMDRIKRNVVYRTYISPIAETCYSNSVNGIIGISNNRMIGQVLFYSLIVFALVYHKNLNISIDIVVSFIIVLLFLLSSIESVMTLYPRIVRAGVSAERIVSLQNLLFSSYNKEETPLKGRMFQSLILDKVIFNYKTLDQVFRLGPISLEIQKCQSTFIYGGNGSGKTTLIYTFLGLLEADEGEIMINQNTVLNSNHNSFRELFAVVFSDFYLFEVNYLGFEIQEKKANFYLRLFELDHKVTFTNNYFTTSGLSLGQKKRLALINILIEDKPVIVLDEWAADQDPYFRNKFYHEIIPYLIKEEKKTIIAITHDDRYFHTCDRLYKMEYGTMTEIDKKLLKEIF